MVHVLPAPTQVATDNLLRRGQVVFHGVGSSLTHNFRSGVGLAAHQFFVVKEGRAIHESIPRGGIGALPFRAGFHLAQPFSIEHHFTDLDLIRPIGSTSMETFSRGPFRKELFHQRKTFLRQGAISGPSVRLEQGFYRLIPSGENRSFCRHAAPGVMPKAASLHHVWTRLAKQFLIGLGISIVAAHGVFIEWRAGKNLLHPVFIITATRAIKAVIPGVAEEEKQQHASPQDDHDSG